MHVVRTGHGRQGLTRPRRTLGAAAPLALALLADPRRRRGGRQHPRRADRLAEQPARDAAGDDQHQRHGHHAVVPARVRAAVPRQRLRRRRQRCRQRRRPGRSAPARSRSSRARRRRPSRTPPRTRRRPPATTRCAPTSSERPRRRAPARCRRTSASPRRRRSLPPVTGTPPPAGVAPLPTGTTATRCVVPNLKGRTYLGARTAPAPRRLQRGHGLPADAARPQGHGPARDLAAAEARVGAQAQQPRHAAAELREAPGRLTVSAPVRAWPGRARLQSTAPCALLVAAARSRRCHTRTEAMDGAQQYGMDASTHACPRPTPVA